MRAEVLAHAFPRGALADAARAVSLARHAPPLVKVRVLWALTSLLFVLLERGLEATLASDLYHVPALWPLSSFEPQHVMSLWCVGGAGALMAALGVGSRAGIAMVVASQGVLFLTDLMRFRNHVYLLLLLGLLLLFAPCHQRKPAGSAAQEQRFVRAIMLQILIVYGFATIQKLNAAYLSGWVLEGELRHVLPHGLLATLLSAAALEEILSDRAWMAALSWTGVLMEGAVALCLSVPRLRRAGVVLGLAFHLTIAVTMNVFVFGLLMVACYPLFLADSVRSIPDLERAV